MLNVQVTGNGDSLQCRKSLDTLENVPNCPKDKEGWNERAKQKNCEALSHNCSELKYHCVLNEHGNGTVEVCAPPRFLQGYCPSFITSTSTLYDHYGKKCSDFRYNPCPGRYSSNETYKYQECYQFAEKQHFTTASVNTKGTTTKHVTEERKESEVFVVESPDSTKHMDRLSFVIAKDAVTVDRRCEILF
ncbi:uncharacterized protein LOC134246902 [Saccostrea cucullata]|uniref:uncharacterized protein LOC134246902 n=1 Tax=Saccostrea cuccullata TaxID=36930 RepID=UPI002ED4709B